MDLKAIKHWQLAVIAALGLFAVCSVCVALGFSVSVLGAVFGSPTAVSRQPVSVAAATDEIVVAASLSPTYTPVPTDTAAPTHTPAPTRTAAPTDTPAPTFTPTNTVPPTPTPQPIAISGQGDSIQDVNFPGPGTLLIAGNAGSRHFAVTNYAPDGEYMDLLVNTTDPYQGILPVDLYVGEKTARLEINAEGPWQITYMPLLPGYLHNLTVPGQYQGNGDDVILLIGGVADIAKVQGNAGSRHFAVVAHGDDWDLLINTTDPYDGSIIVPSGTILLEINAEGPWSLQITAK